MKFGSRVQKRYTMSIIPEAAWPELLKKPALSLILGVVLLILAASGGVSSLGLTVNESPWRITLATIGIVLLATGCYLAVRPEGSRSTHDPAGYGVKIRTPSPGSMAPASFEVFGDYKLLPAGHSIRVFVVEGERHWPQGVARMSPSNKQWRAVVNHMGGVKGQSRTIAAIAMAESGSILCDYYEKAGRETGKWIPITRLTSDMVECDNVVVIHAGH
jgi:hypothetical protein